MQAIINRYPGKCAKCGARVPVAAGYVKRIMGEWATFCGTHAHEGSNTMNNTPPAPSGPAKVVLSPDGGKVLITLEGRLGASWDAFKQAKDDARASNRKIGGEWVSHLDPSAVAGFVAALQAAGIPCEDKGGASAVVQAAALRQETENAAGEARLAAADLALSREGRSLRGYQREGVRWLVGRGTKGALLADDMGLGKTAQALISLPQGARVVVVGPSVAKGVWARELKKWRPDLGPARVLSGRQTAMVWPSREGEVVIINYDILPSEFEGAPAGVFVIFDEAHACKNSKAARTKRSAELAQAARNNGGCVWTLTATPLTNTPPELWSVLSVAGIAQEAFGSFKAFKQAFNAREGRFALEWGRPDGTVRESMRRVMLRRTKLDCAGDLPAKSREVREVPLERDGEKLINDVIKRYLKEGADIDDMLENIDKGIDFEAISAIRAACATAKLPSVLSIAEEYEEAGEPLVVFSAHRAVIDTLAEREGWGRITGSETPEEKTAVEEAFQAGKLRGVAATIKAGGVAITLTRACNAVFVDQAWTPADNVQAEDRIYRIGQTRPVTITILQAAHAMDERVVELLLEKTALYEGAINAARYKAGETPEAAKVQGVALAAYQAPAPTPAAPPTAPPATPGKPKVRKRLWWRGETCADPDTGPARGPQTPREAWAAQALATLAGDDDDRAAIKNEVGFNKADGSYGHGMARELEAFGGLTDRGWTAAVALCGKYWRQVGKPPALACHSPPPCLGGTSREPALQGWRNLPHNQASHEARKRDEHMVNKKSPMRDVADGRKDLYTFDPEKLVIITDPKHPLYDERASLPVDEDMVRNVMHYGILQPILYRTEEINGELVPVVIAGRQRVKAAREANKRFRERGEPTMQVPGMVRKANDSDSIGLLVSENEVRFADDVMVKAAKARRMIETYGYDDEKVAMTFGVSVATLKRYLAVEGATPEVKEAFVKGELAIGAAVELAKLPPSKQKEGVENVKAKADAKAERISARKGNGKAAVDTSKAAREVVQASGGKVGATREHLRSIKQVRALLEYLDKEIPHAADKEQYDTIRVVLGWVMGNGQADIEKMLGSMQMELPKGASDK